MKLLSKILGVGSLCLGLGCATAWAQSNRETRELAGQITNGPAVLQVYRITTLMTSTQLVRLPPHLATNAAYGTNPIIARFRTNSFTYTNLVFERFEPDSLAHLVWTNFMAQTNGRDLRIWSERTHPANWPTNPPVVKWNPNSLIYGMRGFTALSPSWAGQGSAGQVPLTALTRRHVYTRGHGMGPDGFSVDSAGRKVWFLTANNTMVEARIRRAVVRATPGTNQMHRDYTLMLLDRDLPETIEPMAVATMAAVQKFYLSTTPGGAPFPIFQTEQTGNVSSSIPPLTVNTWKGGDSGSPNMIPLPGELVFFSGRSTSGPTPEMQDDMDELCRMEGLNPAKYQMRWADLGKRAAK